MTEAGTPSGEGNLGGRSRAQKQLVGFILVLAVVNVAYRLVYLSGFARSAALYVGVPTVLAIGLALLPRSRSATGMLLKGSTLALLIACVILPEGLLCLLFVVPLVALVSIVVGGAIDFSRRHNRGQGPTLMVITLPLVVMSLEGLIGSPFANHDGATATATVRATPAEVRGALSATPSFERDMPPFLAIGFNRPTAATGSGVDVGDQRTIEFTGRTPNMHSPGLSGLAAQPIVDPRPRMHLTVIESTPGRVVFNIDEDTTMLARWAHLERAVVTWEQSGVRATRVAWRLEYERLLYPTAYFAPLQRFGMGQAASYLLGAVVEQPLR